MKRAGFLRAATVLGVFALLPPASPVFAQDTTLRVVLKGHDPVAYFTDGKPVMGNPKISYDWDDARYYFASAKSRATFAADPDRYVPQFGGYCTGSMSRGVRAEADPQAWVIVDARLYVFGQVKFKEIADKDPDWVRVRLAAADANYRAKK